jgi:photosystem II stability/assembly factor-like uncharacterized protein
MKAMFAVFFSLFLSFTSISYSQFGWYQQYSGTTNNLNSICFSPGTYPEYNYNMFAVGDNGIVLRTTDFGNNWNALNTPTSNNLYSICSNWITGGGRIWISGANGTLLSSTNYGSNWIIQQSGTSNSLNSISFFTATTGIAVGNSGTICRTTNAGNNWIATTYGSSNLNSVYMFSAYVLAVGDNGKIYRSDDYGQSWVSIPSGTNYKLNAITYLDFYPYAVHYAAGNNGVILKSTDIGLSWSTETSGTSLNLYSICASGYPWSVWTAGDNGLILKSLYGFTGWIDDTSRISTKINNIFMGDANTGWAVGTNGTIIHTYTNSYVIDSKKLDANTISTWFRNDASFNRNYVTGNAGFEWPKGSNKFARYASGPYIGAKVGNDTLVSVAEYDYEYYPGYTDNNGTPHGANYPFYRIYRLSYGIIDSDRTNWPNALLGNSGQGAPVYYDDQTHTWKPLDYADQTMFYCYTDSYAESHGVASGSTAPLKVDLKQINFAFDELGAMGNIIYSYFTLINKNTLPWINTYFTIWADDDLGNATDDLVGSDTLLGMGYTYNGTNHDAVYGDAPPAVAFDFIKGPMIYTANNNDTAFICYGKNKSIKIGFKQPGMSVFNWYYGGADPRNYVETYRLMSGLHPRPGVGGDPGLEIINPLTHQPTHFYYSGDPVNSTGWIQTGPNDQRFTMSIGPFNMNPGDTQTIVVAQIIARGTSNLNSIAVLRQYTQIARDNYKDCFANVPIGIKNLSNEVPIRFSLEQNYPNPFNPITKIKFSIPSVGQRHAFDVHLIIYDILGREVATPINQKMKPGHYDVEWDGSNFASGVYFYKLEAGSFVETKKMVLIK